MTTIAYDGRYLAADTRMSEGDFYTYAHKIFLTNDGGVFAGSGTWGLVHRLHDSLNAKKGIAKLFSKAELKKVDGLYINRDLRAFYLDAAYNGWVPIDTEHYAIGSGSEIAWGFMLSGFSPQDAIKATAKVRSCTNDLVDVYDIKKKAFKLVDFPK